MRLPVDRISKRVAGSVPVPLEDFEARLGRPGFRVWERLRALRDDRAVVEATVADLTAVPGFEPLPTRYVRKGLARLRDLGVVSQARGSSKGRGKRRRKVYGAVAETPEGRVVTVPGKVFRMLRLASMWGGKRRQPSIAAKLNGAEARGAVDRIARGAAYESTTPLETTPPQARGAVDGQEGPKKPPQISRGARGAVDDRGASGSADPDRPIPPTGESPRAGAPASNSNSDLQTVVRPVSFPTETKGAPARDAHGRSDSSEAAMGDTHDKLATTLGRFAAPRIHPRLLQGVPRYPGFDIVAPAITPEPPLLRADDTDKRRETFLAATWASAYEARFGRKDWTFRGRGKRSKIVKHRPVLLAAAAMFVEHEIAPAAWLGFSFDVWGAKQHDLKPPPIAWAYNADRIEKRRGWFRSEGASQYKGGLAMTTPGLRSLRKRYASMQSRLLSLRGDPPTDAQVLAVVEKYFPSGLYDVLVDKARDEALEQQERLRHRAAAGDWLSWQFS